MAGLVEEKDVGNITDVIMMTAMRNPYRKPWEHKGWLDLVMVGRRKKTGQAFRRKCCLCGP